MFSTNLASGDVYCTLSIGGFTLDVGVNYEYNVHVNYDHVEYDGGGFLE